MLAAAALLVSYGLYVLPRVPVDVSPTEDEVRDALGRLDPLWDELLPGDQERIVRLLVERVDLTDAGAQIRLNLEGLAGLARDMAAKEAMAA